MARAGRLYGPLIVPIFSSDKSILLQFLSTQKRIRFMRVQHRGKVFKIVPQQGKGGVLFGVGKFDQELASLACEPEMDSPFPLHVI